jgi:hypothetical protein
MRPVIAFAGTVMLASPAFAQSLDTQTVVVGPWTITTTYKGERFENCTMARTATGLEIVFVRDQDGLVLAIDSPKWRLERGKAYSVRLSAGPQSVDAEALAETKSVTIALADRPFNDKLRTANTLEVRGEGATLRLPLDGSAAGLERLDQCFEKNSRETPEANPFVAPRRKP